MSIEQPNFLSSELVVTFGEQIQQAVNRYEIYTEKPQWVGQNWSDLAGHETALLDLALRVATIERPALGRMYSPLIGDTLLDIASDSISYARHQRHDHH